MKAYLESTKLYVKNEDNLIYTVDCINVFDNTDYIELHLLLIAGIDYISEDSDIQGWCKADRFVEEAQEDCVYQYFIVESAKEALEANDYTVLDKLPFDIDKLK